jgi:hypothetical protein
MGSTYTEVRPRASVSSVCVNRSRRIVAHFVLLLETHARHKIETRSEAEILAVASWFEAARRTLPAVNL